MLNNAYTYISVTIVDLVFFFKKRKTNFIIFSLVISATSFGSVLSELSRRRDALGYVMTQKSQCLNLIKVSHSVSSHRNEGQMESECVWAALQVDPSQNGVSKMRHPSSGDLEFLSFLCFVAPLSPAPLESSVRGFARWQVKREGGIFQEILGAKLRSRCIISAQIT